MKLTNIISFIILLVFSTLTFVGTGIYHCGCTHTPQMVLLAFQTTCPCSSSDEDCCPHHKAHHDDENCDEDEDCCSLSYQRTEIDPYHVTRLHDVQAKVLSLFFLPFTSVDGFITGISDCFTQISERPPPGLLKTLLIYMHSQLRL